MRGTRGILGMLFSIWFILVLSACSLSPLVANDVLSYHEAADLTANRILLLNVLRAKDEAPLHFGELSLLHGQVAAQGSVGLAQPIGTIPHSGTLPRAILTPSASLGDQVAYDLGTLDTQNFTQGVTAPIAPKMLKYFLDSGVDYRLVLMLLVSGIRLPGGREAIANFPRSERVVCYPDGLPPPHTLPPRYELRGEVDSIADCPAHDREFVAFLRILNALPRVYAVAYHPFTPVGEPFRPDVAHSLRDLLLLDQTKQTIRSAPGGRFQFGLLASEESIVLCEETKPLAGAAASSATAAVAGTATPMQICGAGNASLINTDAASAVIAPEVPDISLRSTLGIFSFLGQVLGSQDARSTPDKEVCLRLDVPESNRPACDRGQVLFHLVHDPELARFGVEYAGKFWGVPNARPCTNETGHCDLTLQTLAMVSLLLNLNKSARDIPSTPSVQLELPP